MKLQRRKANSRNGKWSPEETDILLRFLTKKLNNRNQLKKLLPQRSPQAIRSKARKLRIANDLFGDSYREEKTDFTKKIALKISPLKVFDAYAGAGHQTFRWVKHANEVFASEKIPSKLSQFHKNALLNGFRLQPEQDDGWRLYKKGDKKVYYYSGDALKAIIALVTFNVRVDTIDLDTCGTTLPSLPIFLNLLNPKNVVITHGEFHSLRFKREDVLRRIMPHWDVNLSPFPISINQLSVELDKAVKVYGLRSHNEIKESHWLELEEEIWLGSKARGMLRRHYSVNKTVAAADHLNFISDL